jgi:uncharacterized membrane protein HdeD (DUF308 family)
MSLEFIRISAFSGIALVIFGVACLVAAFCVQKKKRMKVMTLSFIAIGMGLIMFLIAAQASSSV